MQPGRKLAHYEIVEPIGKGGMGEVYRARDTKLGRDVAIKILPDEFALDEERLKRFQREAKVLASLNHPNIASIYGLEESARWHYLVLELVPGETLAERIARGPIPIDEALGIATQVAQALEEAHEHGIVHRDLKPANVKLTPDDKVKVLDFGLAKAFADDSPDADSSMSPTITRDATRVGVILGTAAYMSPEQAKGKRVDRRTDVFAFGALLYEMLTGRKAFPGKDVSDVLAAVIKLDPDWTLLPKELPDTVDRLIRRSLSKDKGRRLQHIGDARIEIEEALASPPSATPHVRSGRGALFAALAVAILSMAFAVWSLTRPVPRVVTRTSLPLLPGRFLLDNTIQTPELAISPDGRRVAYFTTRNGSSQLFLKAMDGLDPQAISAVGAHMPFFSPDSQWLGFLAGAKLMKVAVSGGAPVAVAEVDEDVRGACWTVGDEIVFNGGLGQGLWRVSAAGGEPELLTTPNRERGEKTHRLPEPLPGGKEVLFTIATGDIDAFDDASIGVLSLDSREYHVVLEGGTDARYSRSGYLVYGRRGSLLVVPFDPQASKVTGSPVPVVEDISVSSIFGYAQFSISETDSLLYARGKAWGDDNRVVWVDREGGEQPLIDTPRAFDQVRISPDGRLLALYVEAANGNLWIYDIARATLTRLTFGFDNGNPVWTPDGRRVTFSSSRTNPGSLFWQPADGSGEAEALTRGTGVIPWSWSRDGNTLAVYASDIDLLPMDGGGTPTAFLHTRFVEGKPMFSPDGRWIAYVSNESGGNEVYLRRFPSAAGKRQVSAGGGRDPKWSANGDELFYLDGDEMMAVDVGTRAELTLGEPRVLFEKPLARGSGHYDVAPDGERFVMIVPAESEPSAHDLILVQNWTEELTKRIPAQ